MRRFGTQRDSVIRRPNPRFTVNSFLGQIRDWGELAQRAGYQARALARLNRVSLRHLERFFEAYFGRTPQFWLDEVRLTKGALMLGSGWTAKEVAWKLGFYDVAHFSRKFKRYHGSNPTRFVQVYRERRAVRRKQIEGWFPGEQVPPEWLVDSTLVRAQELLALRPQLRRLASASTPLARMFHAL